MGLQDATAQRSSLGAGRSDVETLHCAQGSTIRRASLGAELDCVPLPQSSLGAGITGWRPSLRAWRDRVATSILCRSTSVETLAPRRAPPCFISTASSPRPQFGFVSQFVNSRSFTSRRGCFAVLVWRSEQSRSGCEVLLSGPACLFGAWPSSQ
jgi:hypothetical protein